MDIALLRITLKKRPLLPTTSPSPHRHSSGSLETSASGLSAEEYFSLIKSMNGNRFERQSGGQFPDNNSCSDGRWGEREREKDVLFQQETAYKSQPEKGLQNKGRALKTSPAKAFRVDWPIGREIKQEERKLKSAGKANHCKQSISEGQRASLSLSLCSRKPNVEYKTV